MGSKLNSTKLYPHDHVVKWLILPFIPRFVTPNHITILRFALTPFVVWALATSNSMWTLYFFVAVASTDFIDGSLARVRNQITEWGMLYDPFADKILISLVAVVVVVKVVGWWLALLLIFFELTIIFGGITRKHSGKIVVANPWGKSKMIAQCTGITLLIFAMVTGAPWAVAWGTAILLIAVGLAIGSIVTYSI